MLLNFVPTENAQPLPPTSESLVDMETSFSYLFQRLSKQFHENAVVKGFWEGGQARSELEQLALVHSEVSEAVEALRDKDPLKPDQKVPEFSNLECELADAIIRIMDFNRAYRLNVGGALVAKARFNATRPFKHGKTA